MGHDYYSGVINHESDSDEFSVDSDFNYETTEELQQLQQLQSSRGPESDEDDFSPAAFEP